MPVKIVKQNYLVVAEHRNEENGATRKELIIKGLSKLLYCNFNVYK